jgi:lysyl-tRNA synthetase class II
MSDGVVGVRGHVKLTGLRLNSVDVSNSDDAQEAVTNLNNSAENLQAAESRIRDLDMAEEMMAFTKNSILQQAATAMLAQANMAPQSVVDFKKYIAPLFFTKRSRPFRSWRKTYSFYGYSGRSQVI